MSDKKNTTSNTQVSNKKGGQIDSLAAFKNEQAYQAELRRLLEAVKRYEGADETVNEAETLETVLGGKSERVSGQNQARSKEEVLQKALDGLEDGDENAVVVEELSASGGEPDRSVLTRLIEQLVHNPPFPKKKILQKSQAPLPPDIVSIWQQQVEAKDPQGLDIDQVLLMMDVQRGFDLKEFVYLYQPQWDIRTGELESIESHLYWNHPRRGLLETDFFILLFENIGLLSAFRQLQFKQILDDYRVLEAHRPAGIKIGFRLMLPEIGSDNLVPNMLHRMADEMVYPSHFECIVPAAQAPVVTDKTRDWLNELEINDVTLTLDQYGSGYSVYPYFKSIRFDKVRIEQNCLKSALSAPRGQQVLKAMIENAHLLGAKVAADGVDSERDLKWLRSVGCDYAQGSFLAAPMSVSELAAFLTEYQTVREKGIEAIWAFWQAHASEGKDQKS